MSAEIKTIRCMRCRKEFTDAEIAGKFTCPMCNTKSRPMGIDNDVIIKINVAELRILGIWAENYAVSIDNKYLDDAYHENPKEVINIITTGIRKQLKELGKDAPLTTTQEMENLKNAGYDATLYRDGKEEV